MQYRKRNRLKDFDYSQGYWYFVTISVKDMKSYLGKIVNEKMMLNQYGQIVEKKLDWLMNQYFYVEIDSSIVMPNHIHAIIIIDPTNVGLKHKVTWHL